VYLDTSYIAKFYLNEPESALVRELIQAADNLRSSMWAVPEFHAVLHRHVREASLSAGAAKELALRFARHEKDGLWTFIPVNEALLRRTSAVIVSAPAEVFIRTADAIHLSTAREIGGEDVWTNDRHMLAAASYFGLRGRSVSALK
jgi:predicted nucleic acid-binding protein